jgi:hypothetical protein
MRDLFRPIGWAVVDRSRAALEAEIWTLRQQINGPRRTAPKRFSFSVFDRLVFAGLYALAIGKPDTIVRWHRAGFRLYWRWKSRRRGGRPTVPPEIRKLIREMSIAWLQIWRVQMGPSSIAPAHDRSAPGDQAPDGGAEVRLDADAFTPHPKLPVPCIKSGLFVCAPDEHNDQPRKSSGKGRREYPPK